MTTDQPTMSIYPVTSGTQWQMSKAELDSDLVSPPPYPMATFTAGTLPAHATKTSDNLISEQQDNYSSKLSSDNAFNVNDSDKGNETTTSECCLYAEDSATPESLHPQPLAAQASVVALNKAPDSLIVNGAKYVLEQPNIIIPATISAPDPVQNCGVKSLKRVGNFTAGILPVTYQPTIGKQPASSSDTQIHAQAADLVKQHSHTVSQPTVAPTIAGIPVGGGSVDSSWETSMSRLRHSGINGHPGASIDEAESYYDEMSSTPIKVRFDNDPAIFYVHREVLERLLGPSTRLRPTEIVQGEVTVKGTTAWSFHFLLRILYRGSPSSTAPRVSGLSNAQLTDLFQAASKFGHSDIVEDCLNALHHDMPVDDLLRDLKVVYDQGQADSDFRACFRRKLRDSLLFNCPDGNFGDQLVRAIAEGGPLASDSVKTLVDVVVDLANQRNTDNTWHADTPGPAVCAQDQSGWHGDEIRTPHTNVETSNALCAHDDYSQECWFCSTKQSQTNRDKAGWTRSGRVKTATPGDSNENDWAEPAYQSGDDWAAGEPRDDAWGSVDSASQRLQDAMSQNAQHANDWDWSRVRASSDCMEMASASAIANDGWTSNDQDVANSWDASNSSQLLPVANESALPRFEGRGVASSTREPGITRFAAGTTRRQAPPPSSWSDSNHTTPTAPHQRRQDAASKASVPGCSIPTSPLPNFQATPASHIPPEAMPNYVHPLAFIRSIHVGNGVMHPTAPGLYGLAGRTMIATRNSDNWTCSLYFRAGDIITNVVDIVSLTSNTPLYGALVLQGVCRSRHGTFPADYVRNLEGVMIPRTLGSPFNPVQTKRNPANASGDGTRAATTNTYRNTPAGATQRDQWEVTTVKKVEARVALKQAHVSEEESCDEWNAGPTPKGDGSRKPSTTGWGAGNWVD